MKVLAINGSARRNGNTAILLGAVLDVLQAHGIDTELVQLAQTEIKPCKACFTCGGKVNCSFTNDGFAPLFAKMAEADGVLLGSPVYAANISASMQAFLERAAVVADMNPGILRHKAGAAIAAARRGGALFTVDAMTHFFMNHEMFIAGSTYWNIGYGQRPGDVRQDTEGLATMKALGENMAFLLHRLYGAS